MNWYKFIKIAQRFVRILPEKDNMEYISIGHDKDTGNFLWWSNDGDSIDFIRASNGLDDLIHYDIPSIKGGSWKGRFSTKTGVLSIATPPKLYEYEGVPNGMLDRLKAKFKPIKIKVFIVGKTHISDNLKNEAGISNELV